ncbi:MAG: hypothetical protein NTY90_05755 [Candidatus Micrarchaeota archaeon]|nr:hypothetical protein [Candidatus Micrarchaeota archaeon]
MMAEHEKFKAAAANPKSLTAFAEKLKDESFFAKKPGDVDALVRQLHRVWAHTLDEKTLENPRSERSEGKKGLESAHQYAVDGLITLLRAGTKRLDMINAVKNAAPEHEWVRFAAHLRRLH